LGDWKLPSRCEADLRGLTGWGGFTVYDKNNALAGKDHTVM